MRALPQAETGTAYAAKIDKAEARIDWRRPALELVRTIRGLSPYPGAWFEHQGSRIKVLMAEVRPACGAPPGTVIDDGLTVACGTGALRLTRLQRAGKAPAEAEAFLRGFALEAGVRLGCS